jgi:hypothetical protein
MIGVAGPGKAWLGSARQGGARQGKATAVWKSIVLGAVVLSVQPAQAHCYSRWFYPFPQNCRSTLPRMRHVKVETAPDINPVLIPPGWDEEQERREALQQAERQLEGEKHGD